MPDLNDFYAFKMTSSGGGSGRGRNTDTGGGKLDGVIKIAITND